MKRKNNPFLVFGEQSVFDMIALILNKKYFRTLNLGHIWKVPESTHDKNNFNLIPKYFFPAKLEQRQMAFASISPITYHVIQSRRWKMDSLIMSVTRDMTQKI